MDSAVNSSSAPVESEDLADDMVFNVVSACCWMLTVSLIFFFNAVCLAVLARVKEFHSSTKIFLQSMTIGDLVLGLFFYFPMIGVALEGRRRFPFGGLCFVQAWMLRQGLPAYSLSLLLVTIDRYIAVVYPLRYKRLLTAGRAKAIVVLLWTLTNVYALVSSIGADWQGQYNEFLFVCTYGGSKNEVNAFILTILSMAVFLIILLMYAKILLIARSQAAHIAAQRPLFTVNGAPQAQPPLNRKSFTTIFIVTITLFVGWLPSLVMGLMGRSRQISPQLRVASQILLASVSWLNVIIYYVHNHAFRQTGQQVMRKMSRNCCGYWKPDNNNVPSNC